MTADRIELLRASVRDVPDFPKPGILFKDITPMLSNPKAFTTALDPMAGFFALPRAVFERADALSPIGYKIGLELIVKCDCRDVREVPIQFAERKVGESKLSFKEQLNYLKHLKRLADYEYGGVAGALWAGLKAQRLSPRHK
jgi:hypothetical protein